MYGNIDSCSLCKPSSILSTVCFQIFSARKSCLSLHSSKVLQQKAEMYPAFRIDVTDDGYLFIRLFTLIDEWECYSLSVDNAFSQNATGRSCVSLPPLN
jgi:hypothetical protein